MTRLYDAKQWKKALFKADTLLKSRPHLGDVICFKALFLYNLQKRDEALELLKEGIRLSVNNSISWHINGIVQKSERNYVEAIKSMKNALKFGVNDPSAILRDISAMQIDLKEYDQNIDTRRSILSETQGSVNPSSSWLGFAMAHQLVGDAELASVVLKNYDETLDAGRAPDMASTELKFLRGRTLEQAGEFEKALEFYNSAETSSFVLDTYDLKYYKARLYLRLQKYKEARHMFRSILHINPDDTLAHHGLQCTLLQRPEDFSESVRGNRFPCLNDELTPEQVDTLLHEYCFLLTSHPRSSSLLTMPLYFLPASHPFFTPLLSMHLRKGLRSGIPSLFNGLKGIFRGQKYKGYSHKSRALMRKDDLTDKEQILMTLLTGILEALETHQLMPVPELPTSSSYSGSFKVSTGVWNVMTKLTTLPTDRTVDDSGELPSVHPWAFILAAQVYNEYNRLPEALSFVEKAEVHSPTVIDILLEKASILKHMGEHVKAADVMEEARTLDLADRYLNAKAIKYALRVERLRKSLENMELFLVNVKENQKNVDRMKVLPIYQVLWWELGKAEAFERIKNMPMALKHYHRLIDFAAEYDNDIMDYNYFAIRIGTLRPYADLMGLREQFKVSDVYAKAVLGAARCYQLINEDTSLRDEKLANFLEPQGSESGDAGAAKAEPAKDQDFPPPEGVPEDKDPLGLTHLRVSEPLTVAADLVNDLVTFFPEYSLPSMVVSKKIAPPYRSICTKASDIEIAKVVLGDKSQGFNISTSTVAQVHSMGIILSLKREKVYMAAAHLVQLKKVVKETPSELADSWNAVINEHTQNTQALAKKLNVTLSL